MSCAAPVLLARGGGCWHPHAAAAAHPSGCLNEAPCPPFTSHGASIRQPLVPGRYSPFDDIAGMISAERGGSD
jgi:hypothetical protein